MKDALLVKSVALPAAAGSVNTDPLEVKNGVKCVPPQGVEAVIELPALTEAELPDAATITAAVQHSADGTTWQSLYGNLLVQTGADGASAQSKRLAFPSDCGRYVRLQLTAVGSVAASAKSAVFYFDF